MVFSQILSTREHLDFIPATAIATSPHALTQPLASVIKPECQALFQALL